MAVKKDSALTPLVSCPVCKKLCLKGYPSGAIWRTWLKLEKENS